MITGKKYLTQTSVIGAQKILSQGISLAYWVLITSIFTLHEIGIIAVLAIIVNIGTPVTLVRLYTYAEYKISHSLEEQKWGMIHGTVKRTLASSLLIGFGIGAGFFVMARPITTIAQISTEYILLIRLTGIAIIASPLVKLGRSFLNGLLRGYALAYMQLIQPLTLFVSAIIMLPYLRLLGLPIAWIISSVSPFLISLYFIRDIFSHSQIVPSLKEMFTFSLPLCGAGVVKFFSRWVDKILVLMFLGIAPLGLYYLLLNAVNVLRYLSSTLLTLFFPTMCGALERGKNKAQSVLSKVFKFVFAIVFPFFIFSSVVVFPFFSFIFFEKIAGGQLLFMILCIVYAFDNIREILEFTLLAQGFKNIPLQQSVISLVVRTAGLSILFLIWSILDILAVVYVIESFITSIYLFIYFKKYMNIDVYISPLLKIIISGFVAVVDLVIVSTFLPQIEFVILAIGGSLLIYLVLLSLLKTYNDEDIEFLKKIAPKYLHPLFSVFQKLRLW